MNQNWIKKLNVNGVTKNLNLQRNFKLVAHQNTIVNIIIKDQNDWEDDTTQNTPEEAELACLGKLINIVKDGN